VSLLDATTPAGAEHAVWRAAEAGRLLDWAAGSRHPLGGFGWRLRDGALDPARGRQLWIGCRMVHSLALGHLLGRPDDGTGAAAGVHALRTAYADDVHGGWWADADRPGEGRKEAYGHAFVVLAGSTATVAGVDGGRELLDDALAVVLDRFWDDDARMGVESYAVDFTDSEGYRGGNAAMHLVEAFLAAADATGDDAWRARALDVCGRVLTEARVLGWRVPEHHDVDWRVQPDYNRDDPRHPFRPFGATPGHAFEWARLVLTLAATYDVPSWFSAAAVGLATTAWSDAWDGAIGGLLYTTRFDGSPVVRERFHWVACEAAGAAWALHTASGDPRWAAVYDEVLGFTREHLVDPVRPGAWWHELDVDNRPVERTWVGAPDVYHALQSVLLPSCDLAPGLAAAVRDARSA